MPPARLTLMRTGSIIMISEYTLKKRRKVM